MIEYLPHLEIALKSIPTSIATAPRRIHGLECQADSGRTHMRETQSQKEGPRDTKIRKRPRTPHFKKRGFSWARCSAKASRLSQKKAVWAPYAVDFGDCFEETVRFSIEQ